jgi:phosphatidylserine decarboxylase
VYGENVRKIVPIDSPQFGRVMAVCVGAITVGSIKTTVEEGQWVQRGQEFAYFAFGTLFSPSSFILWVSLRRVWFNGTKKFLLMDVRLLKLSSA